METSPKDDFYLYANYDWLLNTNIPEGSKVVGVGMDGDGPERAAAAIAGDELTGHDARLAQLLYRATVDTAARDAAGVEPARATVDAIWLFDVARNAALAGTKPDARLWTASEPALIGTAHYNAHTNSFVIPGGSVESDVARYEAGEISLGEFMGGPAGYLVFHEIGHALDPNDIKIGPHGEDVEESLLEPADLEEFYQTYDVQEGDGMYLDPEARLVFW